MVRIVPIATKFSVRGVSPVRGSHPLYPAAVLPADLFIQGTRRLSGRALVRLVRMRLLTASRRSVAPKSPALAGLVSQQLQSG
jgi:hypothetical protein